MSNVNKELKDLSLLLLYLSGWEEESRNEPNKKVIRTWKGYLFDVLNDLREDGMIVQFMNQKSVILTDKGIEMAKQIKQKFN